jgi:hypothetical protein
LIGATARRTLVFLLAILPVACASPPLPLEPAFDSDEALARSVLDLVEREDREALLRLSITKDEFEDIVWPTLPVSRPEVGMPLSYLWNDTFTKSRSYLAETLSKFGGQRFELVRVEFRGDTSGHETYSVSRKTHLVVRDESGEERTVRLFGSVIRQDGRSKVYSYIID